MPVLTELCGLLEEEAPEKLPVPPLTLQRGNRSPASRGLVQGSRSISCGDALRPERVGEQHNEHLRKGCTKGRAGDVLLSSKR